MKESTRIPFDSLTLAAVHCEVQKLVGARVQKIWQPDESTVVFGLYAKSAECRLLICCDPDLFRVYLMSAKPKAAGKEPPQFAQALRARLEGARLTSVSQTGFDRILTLGFEGSHGPHRLIAELMGKHSNIVLVDETNKIIASAKRVGPSKSKRPVLSGRIYEPPPFAARKPIWDAQSEEELTKTEGASPFLLKLLWAKSGLEPSTLAGKELPTSLRKELNALQIAVSKCAFKPVIAKGRGAYAVSLDALGIEAEPRDSISEALDEHFANASEQRAADRQRASLLAQINRAILAREVALTGLGEALAAADSADDLQRCAEIVMAYGMALEPGAAELSATDFEGKAITIPLDESKSYLENAQAMFDRAKKSKARRDEVLDQLKRVGAQKKELENFKLRAESALEDAALENLSEEARKKRWLAVSPSRAKPKQQPFEGRKVRELLGPSGFTILYGENAEANDYLTTRVAKPTDWWLHVRGSASAHVVVQMGGKPDRITKEVLLFAAKIAVRNSALKHSGYVPVDYTQRKYVRKPRGSPPGSVLYTHEKTFHVELE